MSFMSWHSLPRTLQGFNAVIHFCASAPIGTRYTVQFSAIISWISLGIPHPWINFPNKLWNSLYSIYTYTCISTSKSTELYTLDPFIIDHFLKNWSSRIKMIAQQLVIDCKGGGGGWILKKIWNFCWISNYLCLLWACAASKLNFLRRFEPNTVLMIVVHWWHMS